MTSEWQSVQMSGRGWRREFEAAIQNDIVRGLVEIITNSFDSYSRLGISGEVQVLKAERLMKVTDWAEGMSKDRLDEVLQRYSERFTGNTERGFFGRGAKDALYCMKNSKIITLRAGCLTAAELAWIDDEGDVVGIGEGIPKFRTEDQGEPTEEDRELVLIPSFPVEDYQPYLNNNGTVVEFTVPIEYTCHRYDTLINRLQKHFMLRKINTNPNFKIFVTDDYGRVEELVYIPPTGDTRIDEEGRQLEVTVGGEEFQPAIDIKVSKSNQDLTQSSDYRVGGLLVTDENDSALDITLFDYENNVYADKIFGEIKIHGFRQMLERDETLLDDRRTGLRAGTSLYLKLSEVVSELLQPIIEEEMEDGEEDPSLEGTERSLQRVLEGLNEIANEVLEAGFGGGPLVLPNEIPGGIAFYVGRNIISNINVTKGSLSGASALLLVDTRLLPPGTDLVPNFNQDEIEFHLNNTQVPPPEEDHHVAVIITQLIAREDSPDNTRVGVTALDRHQIPHMVQLDVHASEIALPPIPNGFSFVPDYAWVIDGRTKQTRIWIDVNRVNLGQIELISENDNITILEPPVSADGVSIIDPNAHPTLEQYEGRGIFVYPVTIKGNGVGQEGNIVARMGENQTVLSVKVVSPRAPPSRGLLFNRLVFADDDPAVRSSYHETGRDRIIVIHRNNEVMRYYLRRVDEDSGKWAIIADSIEECVCLELSKKLFERGYRVYEHPEFPLEEQTIEKNRIHHRYGLRIHNLISDPEIFRSLLEGIDSES